MDIDTLTVKQVKELKSLLVGDKKKKDILPFDGGIRIVILQRGWVMVGRYRRVGDNCELTNASVIRTWGTTKGLGEIAINGPTSSTMLDPVPTVSFHRLTEIATLNCKEEKWQAHVL